MKSLSRKESAARDAANQKKRDARLARKKEMTAKGKAVGLQRSGSSKSTGKATYNASTRTYKLK